MIGRLIRHRLGTNCAAISKSLRRCGTVVLQADGGAREIATFIGASIKDDRIGPDPATILHFRNIDPAGSYCAQHGQYKPCEVCDPAAWREHFGLPPERR